MKAPHAWGIRRRLVVGFLAILSPYLILLGLGAVAFHLIGREVSSLYEGAAVELRALDDLRHELRLLTDAAERYPSQAAPGEVEEHLSRFHRALTRLPTQFQPSDPEERRLLAAARAHGERIETLTRGLLGGALERKARLLLEADTLRATLHQMDHLGLANLVRARERVFLLFGRLRAVSLGALVLSIVGGLALAHLMARAISHSIGDLAQASRIIAEGNLSQRVDAKAGGEIGEAARAFNTIAERLESSHASLRRRNEELAAINAIAQVVGSTLEPKEVFKILTRQMAQVVGATRCSLNLWRDGHIVPVMSQFADGHTDPELWAKFKTLGPYRLEEVPVHAEAIRTKRPVAVEDAAASPLYPPYWVETFGVRSALVVPLLRQDEVIGTLNLDRTEGPCAWSQTQVDLAVTIAGEAALAIENARLYGETRRREEEATRLFRGLALLNEATRALHRTLEVESMLSGALVELARVFGAGAALVNTFSEAGGPERSIGHWLSEANGREVEFRAKGGLSELLRQTRQPLFLRDIAERLDVVHPAHFRHGVKSLAALPIVGKSERVLGALFLYYTEPQAFPESDVRLLTAYAEQLATALENARVYEESEARRRAAEKLAEVGRLVSQSLDPEEVGQKVVETVQGLFGCQSSILMEIQPDSESFRVLAAVGEIDRLLKRGAIFPVSTGASGVVLRERRPLTTPDVLADPRITYTPEGRAYAEQATCRAVLAVPLVVQDRAIGALSVAGVTGRVFTDGEIQLAQTFADQTAAAVENARLYEETEARRRAAEALAEVGRDLARSLDLAEVGQRITERIRELLRANSSLLHRLDPGSGDLITMAVSGLGVDFRRNLVFPKGTGASGLAIQQGGAVATGDVLVDPRITLAPEARARIERGPYRAVLALPLVAKGNVIGALAVGDRAGRVFTADEIRLAQAFADQAAVAFENARLYEQTEARRRVAEALAGVGRDLSRSLDVKVVGQRITDSVRQLLGLSSSRLYRLEPASGDLVAVAVSGKVSGMTSGMPVFPPGTGAVGLAVRERATVISSDVFSDPRIVVPPQLRALVEPLRSIVAVPLVVQERVIGALAIGDDSGREFTAEEIQLAQAFADQAALALENARLYAESEARRRAAEALAAVGRDLTRSLDPAALGQKIAESVCRLLGFRFSSLFRLDPTSGDLVGMAASDSVTAVFGRNLVFPRGTGAVALAVRDRRPVVSQDVLADPRLSFPPQVAALVEQAQFRAVVAVPLLTGGRAIGALVVGGEAGRILDDEDVKLAQAFADQAAVALENARLFQEAKQALADLKAAQEQLVQGSTMRALGELAAGASHHLNNLMAIVLGRVRLLLSAGGTAPARRPLEIIERAAADAAEVVRRVSRFARMQPVEEWERVDLRLLAGEVLELTRSRWEDAAHVQGIRIEAALEGQDVPLVVANAAALREALMNLVLNAVEALPEGGTIRVRTFSEDGWVGVTVSDNGAGMSPEVRERALEPFFTTKGPRRTGLGLSVSYGIVQRHGGTLTIESAERRGTIVTLRLPVQSPVKVLPPPAAASPAPPAVVSRRILVVEDDEEVREMVAEMLVGLGHAVVQASGGRAGLALLEAGEGVDLVLTDLGMPEMSGWDVAREVNTRWPGVPVAILTGWGDQIDDTTADRRLVVAVLSKPVSPDDLRKFIATLGESPSPKLAG